jgi:hypothetical protein
MWQPRDGCVGRNVSRASVLVQGGTYLPAPAPVSVRVVAPLSPEGDEGVSYERAKGTGGEVGAIPTTSVAANGRSPSAGAFPKWFTLPVFETSQ